MKETLSDYQAQHFLWTVDKGVAWITLNRPERKNPLTFESYAELRELMRRLPVTTDVKVVIIGGADGNFCSGGDVQEIIGPLTRMSMPELLNFTRMTGDLVKAMRACPQPIIAAVDGVCAGAGAILAMCSDIRFSTPRSKTAFLFTRVGLAGCDMGACAEEALAWGFYSRLVPAEDLRAAVTQLAQELADGPTFAHGMTKAMLNQEWNMSLEQALESEAQAQAICMKTEDFRRAYDAFSAKQRPTFKGN
jgi:enoyl-CoA hydratase/carnithine racemase